MKQTLHQQMRKQIFAAVAASFTLASCFALADTVLIPVGSQGQGLQNIDRPTNGQTEAQVEQRYGKPRQVHGPIGDPPITRWDYADFSVYFEFDKVLHSVLRNSEAVANQ